VTSVYAPCCSTRIVSALSKVTHRPSLAAAGRTAAKQSAVRDAVPRRPLPVAVSAPCPARIPGEAPVWMRWRRPRRGRLGRFIAGLARLLLACGRSELRKATDAHTDRDGTSEAFIAAREQYERAPCRRRDDAPVSGPAAAATRPAAARRAQRIPQARISGPASSPNEARARSTSGYVSCSISCEAIRIFSAACVTASASIRAASHLGRVSGDGSSPIAVALAQRRSAPSRGSDQPSSCRLLSLGGLHRASFPCEVRS